MNPLVIVELALRLGILVVEGQPVEVRQEMWRMHLKDLKWLRKQLGIDDEP